MALIAAENSISFKPIPAGNYIGRCYRVIDLGTQQINYQGQISKSRKVLIGWELFGEDENGQALTTDEGLPLTIAKRYTLSLGEKARLRADFESWRGRAFNQEELKGFDLKTLLNVYGMVNVKHEEREGKTYSNVASLSPLPKIPGIQQPTGINSLQYFDVEEPNDAVFNKLGERLQETIKGCAEWRNRKNSQPQANHQAATTPDGFPDDDVPF